MKKSEKTFSIKNGAIDFYYPMKIDTALSFGDVYDTIDKSVKDFIRNYKDQVYCLFSDEIDTAIHELGIQSNLKVKKRKTKIKLDNTDAKTRGEVIDIALDTSSKHVKINILTNLDGYFNQMYHQSEIDYNYSKEFYGELSTRSQGRIVLPPIEVKLNTGVNVLLEAILIIYKNKTAILRVTLPLTNIDNSYLISNDIDSYIETAKPFNGYPIELKGSTIDMIVDGYCRFLLINKKIKEIRCYKRITNIIIANCSDAFDDVNNIPEFVKEELYKISMAPIQEIRGISYTNEAEEHFKDNGSFFKGVVYIASSMGKCVSIVDKSIVDFAKQKFDKEQVFPQIIGDLRRGAEFSISVLLLKLVNNSYTFEKKGTKNCNLIKVKNDYNRDKIFISMLQSSVYGSVRTLTGSFEKNMTFFVDKENVEDRMVSLNEIVEGEHRNRTEQLQTVLSIIGLIFTTIFGLPAINETLTIIRNICWFIQEDVPYLSIDNCSLLMWLLITVGLSLFMFLKSKIKRFK